MNNKVTLTAEELVFICNTINETYIDILRHKAQEENKIGADLVLKIASMHIESQNKFIEEALEHDEETFLTTLLQGLEGRRELIASKLN